MVNSVDPDQTAPIGAVFSGSTLFASMLNSSVMLGNYLQQTTFPDAFFSRRLRVKTAVDVNEPKLKIFKAFIHGRTTGRDKVVI